MSDENRAPRDFGFGPDQQMLRDLARKFLDERLPVEKLRDLVAEDPTAVYERGQRAPWDPGLWKEIVELGWTGLADPEEAGGSAVSLVGIAGLVEEVGRHALPSPLLDTLNACFVLRELGPAAHPWLSRIADGQAATLAITDERGSWEPLDSPLSAREEGGDLLLSGSAHFVQDAFKADVFVATARLAQGVAVCAMPAGSAGLSLAQDHIHDLTRDQATLHFEDLRVPAENVLARDAGDALRRAWPAVLVTVAADLCGISEWQLQATTEYAKARKQFDRSLGFFQAVKHPLVNAMVAIDRARSLLYHAACNVDVAAADAEQSARMAKSAASDAGAFMSDRSVQLHGGIGFTWECDVHLFFKRSLHDQALYGDGVHHRRRLADAILGEIGAETS